MKKCIVCGTEKKSNTGQRCKPCGSRLTGEKRKGSVPWNKGLTWDVETTRLKPVSPAQKAQREKFNESGHTTEARAKSVETYLRNHPIIPCSHGEIEKWAPCLRFPGWEASNLGCVRNRHGRVAKAGPDKRGYLAVHINSFTIKVHQLVDTAFRGPLPEGLEVDHIDGNKANARLDNLERVTHPENIRRHHSSPRGEVTKEAQRAYALTSEGNAAKKRAGSKGGGSNRAGVTTEQVQDLLNKGFNGLSISRELGVGYKVIRNRIRELDGLPILGKRT